MKRVLLFLATNLAVMLVLSLVTSLLGVNKFPVSYTHLDVYKRQVSLQPEI